MTPRFTIEQFRVVAVPRLAFLQSLGFRRIPHLEETRSTYGTLVYAGKHVGFIFSLDVRDECVDASVVRVENGKIKTLSEGGYSANIFGHLETYAGYRGWPRSPAQDQAEVSPLQQMVDSWVELLKDTGHNLLSDRPDVLPHNQAA